MEDPRLALPLKLLYLSVVVTTVSGDGLLFFIASSCVSVLYPPRCVMARVIASCVFKSCHLDGIPMQYSFLLTFDLIYKIK